jgi:hypothetical protein
MVSIDPKTSEWNAWRAYRAAKSLRVDVMDQLAAEGRSWIEDSPWPPNLVEPAAEASAASPLPEPTKEEPVEVRLSAGALQLGFAGLVIDHPYLLRRDGLAARAGIIPSDRMIKVVVRYPDWMTTPPVMAAIAGPAKGPGAAKPRSWEEFAAGAEFMPAGTLVRLEFRRGERIHELDLEVSLGLPRDVCLAVDTPAPFAQLSGSLQRAYIGHLVKSRESMTDDLAVSLLREAMAWELNEVGAELATPAIAARAGHMHEVEYDPLDYGSFPKQPVLPQPQISQYATRLGRHYQR